MSLGTQIIEIEESKSALSLESITNDYVEIDERFLPLLEISEESSIGIEFLDDNDSIIIEDFDWKTIKGKQILIRKGNAGALNGNDMRKINIAVKAASANPGQATAIREKLVVGFIPDSERHLWQERYLIDGTDGWISSPASVGAANMCIANNVMKGRKRYAGLSRRQMTQITRNEESHGKYPKDSMLKAVNVQAQFNRGMAKEKFGSKPFTVYRGIYGQQAVDIKARAKKGDTVRMNSNTLSSWTTNKEMAKNFSSREKTGIVIQSKVSYKNVFDSYASTTRLTSKQFAVDEVIVASKGLKITGVIIDD